MKRIFLFILPFSLFLSACQKKYDGFNMVYRKDFGKAIPAGASTFLSHYFILENLKPSFKANADNAGVTIGEVLKIIPKTMRLTAKFGDANLSFISRALVYIYPTNKPNEKVEVFYREDIPFNNGTFLDLNAGVADVKKILSNDTDSYEIEIRLDFRSTPPLNIETVVDFSFFAVTGE